MRRRSAMHEGSAAAGPQPRPLCACYRATLHQPGVLGPLPSQEPENARAHWPNACAAGRDHFGF
jgi:hypothetical protein